WPGTCGAREVTRASDQALHRHHRLRCSIDLNPFRSMLAQLLNTFSSILRRGQYCRSSPWWQRMTEYQAPQATEADTNRAAGRTGLWSDVARQVKAIPSIDDRADEATSAVGRHPRRNHGDSRLCSADSSTNIATPPDRRRSPRTSARHCELPHKAAFQRRNRRWPPATRTTLGP